MKANGIVFGLVITVLIGAGYGYYQYSRGNKDLANANADVTINAADLLSAFSSNENTANAKFLNKVVQVRGKLSKTERDQTGAETLYLEAGSDLNYISCLLDSRHNSDAANLKQGAIIVVNGICTGYLTDVVLIRCSVVDEKTN